jgi:siroheme synthase-like protein
VEILSRPVREADVQAADLVIEGTLDSELAGRLATWCRRYGKPLNAMDQLEYCDAYYTAFFDRGPLVVSILSGGDAPALSARLRGWLDEEIIGPGWATAARLLSDLRNRLPEGRSRARLLKGLAHHPQLMDMIKRNDETGMRDLVNDAVHRMGNTD